ncbi:hypothetical protein CPC08DRAFT_745369 [Agrocybe pediades]|nr:hypothetical protein CPC08DRAFT_745369 [Agrocybe pediades]
MLRQSNLQGFKIKGEAERLITTLFADDTTVWLSAQDNFEDLQVILEKWCRVSGAKFNITKTVILPVGTPEYRIQLQYTRKLNENGREIPADMQIAEDGTPVRVLGAYVGNKLDQVAIWTPVLEKIDTQLANWDKGHHTQDGRRLIIGMVVGSLTQYLTRVQGMTLEIEENLRRKVARNNKEQEGDNDQKYHFDPMPKASSHPTRERTQNHPTRKMVAIVWKKKTPLLRS